MKRFLFSLVAFIWFQTSHSQVPGQWVWLHGSNIYGSPGNYGIQKVPNVNNVPPALYEAIQWTDLNGNFWLYGGNDQTYAHDNALWKYDPTTYMWTWMSGSSTANDPGNYGIQGMPSPANRPPAIGYGAATWTDHNNNLWFFGGSNGSQFADLWKYDIAADVWTWMKGPGTSFPPGVYGIRGVPDTANYPAGRSEVATAWTDSAGDLWLFGGAGATGDRNDLWRFNIATNTWTWMKGNNIPFQIGVYGTKGVEDTANTPGARYVYGHWMDKKGNFWIFGGWGQDGRSQYGIMNDLWKYNYSTNNWIWMSGGDTIAAPGRWGTKCTASPYNVPSSRFENRACWSDTKGDLWSFGGGYTSHFDSTWNDLWKYCVAAGEWIWMGGDSTSNPSGSWGTKGVYSATNKPNGRAGSSAWTDNKGNLYFFGGATSLFPIIYNDLWRYTIDTTCGVCFVPAAPKASFASSDSAFCSEGGSCIDFYDLSADNPTSWQWFFPGAIPDTSTLQNPTVICYYTPGTYSVTLIVSNAVGNDTLTVNPMITFGSAPPPPIISLSGNTLTCSHAAAYQWYFNGSLIPGAVDSFYVATMPGNYSVMITDEIGCNRLSAGVWAAVNEPAGDGGIKVYPNPANDKLWVMSYGLWIGKSAGFEIKNVLGESVSQFEISNPKSEIDIGNLAKGIYMVEVKNGEKVYRTKFIKD